MSSVALAEVCELIMGQAPAGESYNDDRIGLPLIAGASDFGDVTPRPSRFTTEASKQSRIGDIIICIRATIGDLNWSDDVYCLGRGVTGIRVDRSVAEPRYIWWALDQNKKELSSRGRGATFKQVNRADIASLLIPLPPLDEQRRIAAVLDQADALRRKRREAIAGLDRLLDADFSATFGDPKAEGSRWPSLTFDAACSDETAKSEKLQRGDYMTVGTYPVVDQGQSKVAGWTDDSDLLCQSKLPVIVFGDHTRAVKFVNFPFVIGADGAKVLKPSRAYVPTFFAQLLRRLPLPDLGYSRHMREVKRLSFPHPPAPLQQQFAQRVETVERLRNAQEAHLMQLDTMFSSLQHRAFNGHLTAKVEERELAEVG